jgi:tetratricopeptide (TPR) repeat protein
MLYEKTDAGRAVTLHNFAGQEFLRAKDPRSALAHYATSLRLSPANTDALIGHAESYMASERYWEAVDDLNRVIATQPKNLIALRQRGRAWLQLGNDKNAQEDFERAEAMNPPAANEAAKP